MPSRKLTYFQFNGLAESIRYMLHYGKLDFEDVRLTEWPIPEIQSRLPLGQLPIYEKDGRVINQSIAIARYVASEVNLLPSDPWEQAELDAKVLNINDLVIKMKEYFLEKDPERKAEIRKTLDGTIEFFLSRFEKELKAGNGYFAGKLTWADFFLVGIIEALNLHLRRTIETDYPTIVALEAKIHALPGVKEYIEKREPYTFTFIGD